MLIFSVDRFHVDVRTHGQLWTLIAKDALRRLVYAHNKEEEEKTCILVPKTQSIGPSVPLVSRGDCDLTPRGELSVRMTTMLTMRGL